MTHRVITGTVTITLERIGRIQLPYTVLPSGEPRLMGVACLGGDPILEYASVLYCMGVDELKLTELAPSDVIEAAECFLEHEINCKLNKPAKLVLDN